MQETSQFLSKIVSLKRKDISKNVLQCILFFSLQDDAEFFDPGKKICSVISLFLFFSPCRFHACVFPHSIEDMKCKV